MLKPRRWPKGTWMRLISRERLASFVGDPAKDPSRKMSGRRLARCIGKHPSFIDHLLQGRRSSCAPRTAEMIAEALDVPLEILFMPETASNAGSLGKQEVA